MKAFCLLISIGFVPLAHADLANLEASLLSCLSIADETERLACFEEVARGIAREAPAAPAPTTAAVAPTPPPVAATPAPSPPAATPVDTPSDFGREHRPSARHAADSMSARVVAVERSGYGELRITLDNGQVWKQIGTERYQLRSDDAVVIERASFNSFFLRKDGSTRKVRFTRLE